jgi:hypothetical protein
MKKRMLVALLCLATTPLAAAPSAPSSSPNSLAEQTAEYISAIMAVWSDPKEQLADVLDVVDLLYGQQVVYYGKTTNKKAVLADKRRFMQRWPERRCGTAADLENDVRCHARLCCERHCGLVCNKSSDGCAGSR